MKILILSAFFLISTTVFAQQKVNRRAQNSFNRAQEMLRQLDYDLAVENLNLAVSFQPDYQQAYVQLGDIYRKKKLFKQAIPFYLKALANPIPVAPMVYFGIGESELGVGDYENASKHLQTYIESQDINPTTAILAKKYQGDCLFAVDAMKHPVAYQPINMGAAINSSNRDYFPTLTADGEVIIFTRQVDGNEDFYTSKRRNNEWQPAEPLSKNINTVNFNEGAQSITPDGMYLFFTGCNRPDGMGRCDIFVSHKVGNDWGKPTNLGAPINSTFWESQPAVSPDGNTLYFVSNRPGGYGGFDIYKSTFLGGGKWSNPKNLGPEINSPYDENTPFLHPDGKTLYFSSDGWPGMGNKDIFLSRMQPDGQFGKPINLGYPINSFNEESGLTVTADGEDALFSAEQPGGYGSQDIYIFPLPISARPTPIVYIKGMVKDKVTSTFLYSNVVVENLETNNLVYNDFTSSETGDFLAVMPTGANYSFNVRSPGYLFYSENYPLIQLSSNKPMLIEILLEKIHVGADVILKNIFFDTNKFELLPTSISELSLLIEFLNANQSVHIEIQGHTDDVGNDALNEQLSINRALAVRDYLIKMNIDVKRLTYKGFGKTKPIASNSSPEGQQKNRRTTFLITEI